MWYIPFSTEESHRISPSFACDMQRTRWDRGLSKLQWNNRAIVLGTATIKRSIC